MLATNELPLTVPGGSCCEVLPRGPVCQEWRRVELTSPAYPDPDTPLALRKLLQDVSADLRGVRDSGRPGVVEEVGPERKS